MSITPIGSTSCVFEDVKDVPTPVLIKTIVKQCQDVEQVQRTIAHAHWWSVVYKLDELRGRSPVGYDQEIKALNTFVPERRRRYLQSCGEMIHVLRGSMSPSLARVLLHPDSKYDLTAEEVAAANASVNPLSEDELNELVRKVMPDRLQRTLASRSLLTWTSHCRAFLEGTTSLKAIESKEATQAEVDAVGAQMARAQNARRDAEVQREQAKEKAKALGIPAKETEEYKRADHAVQDTKRKISALTQKAEKLQQRVDDKLVDLKERAKELEVKLAALNEQRSNAALNMRERIFRLKRKIKDLKQVLDPRNNWEAKDCGPKQARMEARIIRGGFASDFYSLRQYLKWYDHYAEEDREAINPLLLEQLRLLTEIRDAHFPEN